VILQTFNLIETTALFNHGSHHLNFGLSQLENVVDTIKNHLNDLGVLATQKVTEWRDDTLFNKIGDLNLIAGNGEVRNGPRGFFLSLKFTLETKG
jgi:hypothetical protein